MAESGLTLCWEAALFGARYVAGGHEAHGAAWIGRICAAKTWSVGSTTWKVHSRQQKYSRCIEKTSFWQHEMSTEALESADQDKLVKLVKTCATETKRCGPFFFWIGQVSCPWLAKMQNFGTARTHINGTCLDIGAEIRCCWNWSSWLKKCVHVLW